MMIPLYPHINPVTFTNRNAWRDGLATVVRP